MQHAGFDGLNNPQGVAMIFGGFFLIAGIIIGGAGMVKRGLRRESEMRAELRRQHAAAKKNSLEN